MVNDVSNTKTRLAVHGFENVNGSLGENRLPNMWERKFNISALSFHFLLGNSTLWLLNQYFFRITFISDLFLMLF